MMTATISISDNALFTLLLEGLEAYAIKHEQKQFLAIETHAQLWGRANKKLPFKCHVQHASVDSSAAKNREAVCPNPLALELKKDVAAMFGESFQHLGTFHTHPWIKGEKCSSDGEHIQNAKTIRDGKLYNFSYDDYSCEIERPTIEVGARKFSVALVMTIFSAQKADDRKDEKLEDNLYEFSLGNIKIWLKAQAYEHIPSEHCSEEQLIGLKRLYGESRIEIAYSESCSMPIPLTTSLESEFLQQMGYYLEKFGRLAIDFRKSNYSPASEAEKRILHSC